MKRVVVSITVVALHAAIAHAHTVGISRGQYRVSGRNVQAELVFARPELVGAVPPEAIVDGLEVLTPSGSCPGELENASLTEEDGIAIRIAYRCSEPPETLSIRLHFLGALSSGHRHLASAIGPGGETERAVAYEARPEVRFSPAAAERTGDFWPLFRLGTEHILTGYDHLVFLFGLILVGGRLRSLLVVVTAFTLAHSVTLGLAALRVWTPDPGVVEPAIALSIAYVGVENWFVKDVSRRWLITFPFGLIHGFGFAGALGEISLPPGEIPVALAAFNLGVEVGQIAVLAATLPAVLWLGRRRWFAGAGVRAASGAIAVAGLLWFAERLA